MPLPYCCPLCDAEPIYLNVVTRHVFGDPTELSAFYKCKKCSVIFQYPGLSPEQEQQFYLNEFEKFMDLRAGAKGGWENGQRHIKANQGTKERRLKYLNSHLENKSSLLEIGCSSGFMIDYFKSIDMNCVGIEPSGVFSQFLKSRNIDVYKNLAHLKSSCPTKKFDLIVHFFVLEHIADPLTFLSEQLEILNKGGRIIFEIPNAADPLFSVYDIPAFERFYWSVAHPWYFDEKSLQYLLQKLGSSYEIILDQRYDLSNHINWALTGSPGGSEKFTHLLGVDIENNYKTGLIKTGNCDTLIGIIYK